MRGHDDILPDKYYSDPKATKVESKQTTLANEKEIRRKKYGQRVTDTAKAAAHDTVG